jgi:predicted ATP-grasp superfamily ATP-dependent carboligase
VKVTVAGGGRFAPSRWSRYATTRVAAPPVRDTKNFIQWLLEYGETNPGLFLYPTSDDLVWLLAANADALSRHYLLHQPPLATILDLLDKKRLHEACRRAKVETVPTWFAQTEEEARALAPSLPFPIFLKPRTQVLHTSGAKGELAVNEAELLHWWREMIRKAGYLPELEADFGDVTPPMLQQYCEQAVAGIYSLAGYVDRGGDILGARASVKVLQRPRRIGIGLCFESAALDPVAAGAVSRLCKETGYFGVFEAEFISEQRQLIDFNPRFYGQMGFENARGLPLAYFALLGATGDRERLKAAATEARLQQKSEKVYCHRFYFQLTLTARRMAGLISSSEHERWRKWFEANRSFVVDASADPDDRMPNYASAVTELFAAARHPRGFYKGLRD